MKSQPFQLQIWPHPTFGAKEKNTNVHVAQRKAKFVETIDRREPDHRASVIWPCYSDPRSRSAILRSCCSAAGTATPAPSSALPSGIQVQPFRSSLRQSADCSCSYVPVCRLQHVHAAGHFLNNSGVQDFSRQVYSIHFFFFVSIGLELIPNSLIKLFFFH